IEYPPPKPPIKGIIGGAGTYSALGARLFSPAPALSGRVGWIVDRGTDFPDAMTAQIQSWQTGVLLRSDDPDRLTTRGWNGYTSTSGDPDHRAFRYLTPKKRLTGADLADTPLLHARAFHVICSPNRCRELVSEILALRKEQAAEGTYVRPLFIWEPVPDLCTPDELLNCTNALPLVDVCSPNHAELAGFLGGDGLDPDTGSISTKAVESACEQLLASMPLQSYTLVIRAGERGCYVARNGGRKRHPPGKMSAAGAGKGKKKKSEYVRGGLRPDTDMFSLFAGLMRDEEGVVAREEIEVDPGVEMWVPPYHTDGGKVVDPTGGGNTFLGGLAVALARGKTVEEACAWGSVAASFAIEQVGVPELGADGEGRETWNCVRVDDRLKEFKERIGMS
ncbi:Ribokinase-like protein, partial [Coniochaeta ligniaria NRRL 30616]